MSLVVSHLTRLTERQRKLKLGSIVEEKHIQITQQAKNWRYPWNRDETESSHKHQQLNLTQKDMSGQSQQKEMPHGSVHSHLNKDTQKDIELMAPHTDEKMALNQKPLINISDSLPPTIQPPSQLVYNDLPLMSLKLPFLPSRHQNTPPIFPWCHWNLPLSLKASHPTKSLRC